VTSVGCALWEVARAAAVPSLLLPPPLPSLIRTHKRLADAGTSKQAYPTPVHAHSLSPIHSDKQAAAAAAVADAEKADRAAAAAEKAERQQHAQQQQQQQQQAQGQQGPEGLAAAQSPAAQAAAAAAQVCAAVWCCCTGVRCCVLLLHRCAALLGGCCACQLVGAGWQAHMLLSCACHCRLVN